MKKGLLYSPIGIAGVACVVAGLLTLIVVFQVAHPSPDSPGPWYSWFLTPGFLGIMMLNAAADGVTWIPRWLSDGAFLVANILWWAPVTYVVIRLACHSCITRSRSTA
jgi:hypothetical protein